MSLKERMVKAIKDDLGMTPEAHERKERELAERRQRVAVETRRRENTFAGIWLNGDRIESEFGSGPVRGAHATVDANRRLLGKDLYLTIEGVGWSLAIPVDRKSPLAARAFAAKVNAAAARPVDEED